MRAMSAAARAPSRLSGGLACGVQAAHTASLGVTV
jgi:hypothetical protein